MESTLTCLLGTGGDGGSSCRAMGRGGDLEGRGGKGSAFLPFRGGEDPRRNGVGPGGVFRFVGRGGLP